jgi:hypothetical protein
MEREFFTGNNFVVRRRRCFTLIGRLVSIFVVTKRAKTVEQSFRPAEQDFRTREQNISALNNRKNIKHKQKTHIRRLWCVCFINI